jgi:hypothetical protein
VQWVSSPRRRFSPLPSIKRRSGAELRADQTTFLCHDDGKLYCFWRKLFLIDGSFPAAAD